MYEAYWGLKEKPFENTPDPRFLYLSGQYEEGLARLTYAVTEERPVALLTGVYGCGKTLLAMSLFSHLNENIYCRAFVSNPRPQSLELLRSIARALGAENLPAKATEMSGDYFLEVIEDVLVNNDKDGKRTVLVIDEAHVLTLPETFEELRMLLNFQDATHSLFTMILMGQPELKERIHKYKQFLQRIPIAFHLEPLDRELVGGYINHRWDVGGGGPGAIPFANGAVNEIYDNSGGIPRRINQICDMALRMGFHMNLRALDEAIIVESASSLGV